eukprot:1151120-Pelagomonas_calceolata.AAC.4
MTSALQSCTSTWQKWVIQLPLVPKRNGTKHDKHLIDIHMAEMGYAVIQMTLSFSPAGDDLYLAHRNYDLTAYIAQSFDGESTAVYTGLAVVKREKCECSGTDCIKKFGDLAATGEREECECSGTDCIKKFGDLAATVEVRHATATVEACHSQAYSHYAATHSYRATAYPVSAAAHSYHATAYPVSAAAHSYHATAYPVSAAAHSYHATAYPVSAAAHSYHATACPASFSDRCPSALCHECSLEQPQEARSHLGIRHASPQLASQLCQLIS